MNFIYEKRQDLANKLAQRKLAREAQIERQVEDYRRSLQSRIDTSIEQLQHAVDLLDELEKIDLDVFDNHEIPVQQDEQLHEQVVEKELDKVFKRPVDRRPGMQTISTGR